MSLVGQLLEDADCVRGMALRLARVPWLADDIEQDLYVYAVECDYRGVGGPLHPESIRNRRRWARERLRGALQRYWRRRGSCRLDWPDSILGPGEAPDVLLVRKELNDLLWEYRLQCSDSDGWESFDWTLVLEFIGGVTIKELASRHCWKSGTVRRHVRSELKRIGKFLNRAGWEGPEGWQQ